MLTTEPDPTRPQPHYLNQKEPLLPGKHPSSPFSPPNPGKWHEYGMDMSMELSLGPAYASSWILQKLAETNLFCLTRTKTVTSCVHGD